MKLFFIKVWTWIKALTPWVKFTITEAKILIAKIKEEMKK